MAEDESKTPAQPPEDKKTETTVPPKFDIDSLMNEIMEEERAKREEQDKKLKNIEEKSLSQDELKEALKGVLKSQSKSIEEVKSSYEEKINKMQEQLNNISNGTKVPPQVENKPFQAPAESNPQAEMDKLKEENYDLWCLKHFGVLR